MYFETYLATVEQISCLICIMNDCLDVNKVSQSNILIVYDLFCFMNKFVYDELEIFSCLVCILVFMKGIIP